MLMYGIMSINFMNIITYFLCITCKVKSVSAKIIFFITCQSSPKIFT